MGSSGVVAVVLLVLVLLVAAGRNLVSRRRRRPAPGQPRTVADLVRMRGGAEVTDSDGPSYDDAVEVAPSADGPDRVPGVVPRQATGPATATAEPVRAAADDGVGASLPGEPGDGAGSAGDTPWARAARMAAGVTVPAARSAPDETGEPAVTGRSKSDSGRVARAPLDEPTAPPRLLAGWPSLLPAPAAAAPAAAAPAESEDESEDEPVVAELPVVAEPVIVEPEVAGPAAVEPAVEAEVAAPGAVESEVAAPGAVEPAVEAEVAAPAAVESEVAAPGAVEPAAVEAEVAAPAAVERGVVGAEVAAPSAVGPAAVETEVAAPAAAEPGVVGPEVAAPSAVGPAAVEPEVAAPAAVGPAAVEAGFAGRTVAGPEVAAPAPPDQVPSRTAARLRRPADTAAEQAAADLALLRTFGVAGPGRAPQTDDEETELAVRAKGRVGPVSGVAQPVRVHVVGRTGSGIDGAVVTLHDHRGHETASVPAGPDGRAVLTAPHPGGYVIVAASGGHQPGAAAVTVAEVPVEAEIVLTRSATLAGTVTGVGGPQAGARVVLVQDGDMLETATTGAAGGYRFGDLTAGEYGLSVTVPDGEPAAVLVHLSDEQQVRRDVELVPSGLIAGTGS